MQYRKQIAGAIGSVLEWYDFAVFGFLAPIMSPLFFPDTDPIVGLIQTYGVFAAGYLMRPLGGVLFGYVADRIGRTQALKWSIAVMAVPTVLIGLLPTYEQWGVAATGSLILLRLIQGVSVGGELIASITFLVESAPPKRRALYGSWAIFGGIGGILLGSAVVSITEALVAPEQMATVGWRIPFLLGVVIFLVGRWLRASLSAESVVAQATDTLPVVRVLRQHLGSVLHLFAAMLIYSTSFYILFVWMPTYQTRMLPNPVDHAMDVNTITMLVLLLLVPVAGALGDRFGYRRIIVSGVALTGILAYPLFLWIDRGTFVAALSAGLIFAITVSWVQGPMPAVLAETFPKDIRNTGIGVAYNLVLGLMGGTAPMVCTWLIASTGNDAAPAYYLMVLAVISLIALSTLPRYQHD
jgi:MHS family proline/betaine transporter-like MFS transporter